MGSESNKITMLLPGGWSEEDDGTGVRNRHIEDFIFLTILYYRGLQNAYYSHSTKDPGSEWRCNDDSGSGM